MPFGKTLEKIQFDRWLDYRSTVPIERPARERDRSLPGKVRRIRRKQAQRAARRLQETWEERTSDRES